MTGAVDGMSRLLFHGLLLPLAYLPLWLHYRLSDLLAPLLYHVVRYRRRVVEQNLRRAYPQATPVERRRLAHRYYRHMSDLIVEGVYNLRVKPRRLLALYRVVNPELVARYYDAGQSVMLLSAHYNNWEYMVSSLDLQLKHHGVGVGKPLSDADFGRLLNDRRTRLGTEVVDQTNVRDVMEYYHRVHLPVAYMMLGDQSPSNPHKSYWTHLFGTETDFLFGTEYFARKYHFPVLFYAVRKVRRGRYEVRFEPLVDDVASVAPGEVTERYVRRLETLIAEAPQYWLWSHNRWKHTRPDDMPLRTVLPAKSQKGGRQA